MKTFEINFDGIVGPTHNYSGLSFGNTASIKNSSKVSNPKKAALQGIKKMGLMHSLGIAQGVLPPQLRPDLYTLRKIGFTGTDLQVIYNAGLNEKKIYEACCSASSMWSANCATVSSSADTADSKVHFTPANLVSKLHRSIEPETTSAILKAVFNNKDYFTHHPPLPLCEYFSDEGAANHIRLCKKYENSGVSLFVYGKDMDKKISNSSVVFPARQSLQASKAIARVHKLDYNRVVFIRQSQAAIDAGVFHNDVISLGNKNVFLFHEKAFENNNLIIDKLRELFKKDEFYFIEVLESKVSLKNAVLSYLFNSQLVLLENGKMLLIVPEECSKIKSVNDFINELVQKENPISGFKTVDLKESMLNGGGPACLRLKVVLNQNEINAVNKNVLYSIKLESKLVNWIDHHYRDRLCNDDLKDPDLFSEGLAALDELTQILKLGSVYKFQL